MSTEKRVLVIGSNSFAGSSFVDKCLSMGHRVLGMSRSEEPPDYRLVYKGNEQLNQFQFLQRDINQDTESIFGDIKDFQPHYVADFAAQGMVAQSWSAPEQWYQTNVVGKVKLHNYLKDLTSLERYLRISTPEVYGSNDEKIKENSGFQPSTPYAVSHAAIDMSLQAFYNQYQFPVVFTRTANFYGAGQQLYRIIPRTIIYARMGKTLTLDGGGTSVRSFIFSSDFSEAMYLSMVQGQLGESYNIATEEYVTIRQLVELICEEMGISFESFTKIGEERPGKDHAYLLDTEKIRKELNWEAKVSLRQGIQKTIEWVDYNLDLIKNAELNYIHKV